MPVSSATRMNSPAATQAAFRMLPARERLEARHPARRELHLRLVGDPELMLVEGGAELRSRALAA